jgi:hypothetical protein
MTICWKVNEECFLTVTVLNYLGNDLFLTLFLVFHLQDDPEIPFTEDDYRRRKPHSNFKEHISAEKTVIKLGKTVSILGGCKFLHDRALHFAGPLLWSIVLFHAEMVENIFWVDYPQKSHLHTNVTN